MSKIYIILTPGRSASSFLSNCFHKKGIKMFETSNGHAEDDKFKDLNTRILRAAGGSAYNIPPQRSIDATFNEFKAEIEALIGSYSSKYDKWGFKDPRTLFTIDLYKPFLEKHDVYYFFSLREFKNAKKSLVALRWTDGKTADKLHKRQKKRLLKIIGEL